MQEKTWLKIGLVICLAFIINTALAIFGLFQYWLVFAVLIVAVLYVVVFFVRNLLAKGVSFKKQKIELLVVLVIVIFSLLSGYYHHEWPTGRDDLSYIVAAEELTKSGSLSFSDHLSKPLHGLRNIGGDTYTSQFLPAYNTYLASFRLILGQTGLFWANSLLLALSLLALYYLAKNLANRTAGLLAVTLAITSFVFNWFPRRTNTENLSLFLIWLAIWFLVYGWQKKDKNYILLGLIPLSFSILSRIESFAYLFFYLVAILILFKFIRYEWVVPIKKVIKWLIWIVTLSTLGLFVVYNYLYSSKYVWDQICGFFKLDDGGIYNIVILAAFLVAIVITIIKLLKKNYKIKLLEKKLKILWLAGSIVFVGWIVFLKYQQMQDSISRLSFKSSYSFFVFEFGLLMLFFLLAWLVLKRKNVIDYLIWLICLPTFVYLLEPYIAYDLPWFLRRYYPIFIPLIIIMTSVFLVKVRINNKLKVVIILLIILGNICLAVPFLTFVDHQGLSEEVNKLSRRFDSKEDLIVSQYFPHNKIISILHYIYDLNGIHSILDYSEEEIRELVSQYKNIYFIFGENFSEYPYLSDNCQVIETISLNFTRLERTNRYITAYLFNNENLSAQILRNQIYNGKFFPPDAEKISEEYYLCLIKDKTNFVFDLDSEI